jgi:regulator of sigma E protease
MFLTILIVFFSLLFLVVLHEFFHFIVAKKFGVKVEEFGIGLPPRLFGKKIGETVYSLNLLPLGAFIRVFGEEEKISDPRSFSQKPIYQRALIILAGVLSFWLISFLIFSLISFLWGLPTALPDEISENVTNLKIQILEVLPNSPAEKSGFQPFDSIIKITSEEKEIYPQKIIEVQNFFKSNIGKEIKILVERAKEKKEILVSPNQEGKIGVALLRIGWQKSPWHLAPFTGMKITFQTTEVILKSFAQILKKFFAGEKIVGVQLRGPIGIGEIFVHSLQMGLNYFLYFFALISIYLAIFNILPIPAVDGGRLLFLGIEALRKKPIDPKIEQRINTFFFFLLILLLIFVTIKDIQRLI